MFELGESELIGVSGGAVLVKGDMVTVTDASVMNFGGVKFTATAICQNEICSKDIFNAPMLYNFERNGQNAFMIKGEYIENGAIYHLSEAKM